MINFKRVKSYDNVIRQNNLVNKINTVKMKAYFGKKDIITSKECLEWKNIFNEKSPTCLPIGGQSIYATKDVLDKREKVLVIASIDSIAEFHDLAYGASDSIPSIATLLIISEALSRITFLTKKQIMFFFSQAGNSYYILFL